MLPWRSRGATWWRCGSGWGGRRGGWGEAEAQRAQEASVIAWAGGGVTGGIISTASISMSFLARQMQVRGQLQDAWQVLRQAVQLGETPDGIRCASVCWAYTIQADL